MRIEKTIGGLRTLVAGDETKPPIVLFHGYKSSPEDLYFLYKIDPKNYCWYFPEGPYKTSLIPGIRGAAWFHIDIEQILTGVALGNDDAFEKHFPPDVADARVAVGNFLSALNAPTSDLILGGFSQGAIVATELCLTLSDKISGLLLLSGTLIHQKRWESLTQGHENIPFFQSHGVDDEILPIGRAERLYAVLTRGGLAGRLIKFDGGHELPPDVIRELAVFLDGIARERTRTSTPRGTRT